MQLYLVDTESTPPYPRGSVKPRRLRDLAWMQDFQECRVHDHGFGLSHQFGHDGASQGFDEPPEPEYPPVKRGGVQTDHAGEQLREKRVQSRRKERSDSTPRSCWKSASVMTSESERRFMDS